MSERTKPDVSPANRADDRSSEEAAERDLKEAAERDLKEAAERDPKEAAEHDLPVPLPAEDAVTVELVRDAVGVSRGELSDERFSEKYGIGSPDDSSG